MRGNRLAKALKDRAGFIVVAELTGGPGYRFDPIERFLQDAGRAEPGTIPADFDFVGVTLPQNPGGVANLDPSDVLGWIEQRDLAGELDVIPHLSCKDANADALLSALIGFRSRGVRSVLALTGDKPLSAKGVFDLESVTLLKLITRLNRQAWMAARPGQWDQVPTLTAGAAVSPFKYTEGSLMQQYFKMEKKIAAGARFLITQVGWDWRKSVELMQYLRENHLDIPILGNVYVLSRSTPAPRLMYEGRLPGCYVSERLFRRVMDEPIEQSIERAAQQVAMYRAIGTVGVDIGGVHDFGTFARILQRAAEIGMDWEPFKENLAFAPDEGERFYLYDEQGRRTNPSTPRRGFRRRGFELMHRAILDPEHVGFRAFRGLMQGLGAQRGRGFVYHGFHALERAAKYVLFRCEDCGDCYLPEHFGYCTLGGCAKGLANAPCGDATVDGYCGNDLEQTCRGEQIYYAAAATPGGLERLRQTINPPRNPGLEHTSSILNYLFARDHTMGNALISIGESIHASIPKTGKVMRELVEMGPGAYEKESGPLNYMRALIEDQAEEGADYIAVNVDAFGEDDPQLAVDLMVQYVKLVRRWGRGVPVCLDSSDDAVLKAGLAEWFREGDVRPPLVNSIKVYTADEMMPLKKTYDFSFIGLLVSEDKAQGPGGSHSVEELCALAEELFDKAMAHGFKPEEIFFDSTVFPLAIDMPMEPGVPGYTYRAFETIRWIKGNPKFKGVHCSLGISNCCRDLPGRRIGICRAYVAKAMEYGLDAGIVNVSHHYGQKEVDPKLYELVDAFAKMDGSSEATNRAMMLMGQFCAENRKA